MKWLGNLVHGCIVLLIALALIAAFGLVFFRVFLTLLAAVLYILGFG